MVIDASTVDEQGWKVGDTVQISTLQPKRDFRLVGVAQYGDVDSLGGISFTVFTIPTAQELLGREGQYDAISVSAREGVSEDELVAAIEPVLPQDAKVVSATAEAEEQTDDVSEFTKFFRYFLLAFAGVALFVGAFVIFNTFSITVAQRTREFATLRTIGASRRQVLGSVILESLVIGLLASLVGLGLGIFLAEGIQALFKSLGADFPTADRVFATRTVVVSLVIGVGITLLAGLFPAIRATRVPPIAAVREGATLPHSRFHRFTPWIAGVFLVVSLLALARAMFTDELGTGDRLLSIAGGVLLLFLGVAMLSSHLVRPIARVVGLPARGAGGVAGRLASGNAVRNPARTAATAAALMIGIALVSFIATLTNGMKASNREAIEEQIIADYVVTSTDGYTPFVAAAGDALAASSVPEIVTNVRSDVGQVNGASAGIGGIEPDTIAKAYVFDWQNGRRRCAREARHDECVGQQQLRRGSRHCGRRRGEDPLDRQPFGRRHRHRDVRAPALLPAARERERVHRSLRLALRAAAQPLDVGERGRRSVGRESGADGERRSQASPTRSSRPARSGSTARTRTSTSSSRSSTSCSRSPSS